MNSSIRGQGYLSMIRLMCLMVLFGIALFTATQPFAAGSEFTPKLEGEVSIGCCAPPGKCIPAETVAYDYGKLQDPDPSVFRISMHGSPWHLYYSSMRIATMEEVAEAAKPELHSGIKRIILISSWSGIAPDQNSKSLAQRLSDALGGFPVSGMDGFVWLIKDGTIRTTHQAVTFIKKCPYEIHDGDEIMTSLLAGWPILFEESFTKKHYSHGLMRVGAAWEIFMLNLDRALQSYEAAAKLSDPIAAYNAAIIRLERNQEGDFKEATRLLKQAAGLGDDKAQVRIQEMARKTRGVSGEAIKPKGAQPSAPPDRPETAPASR